MEDLTASLARPVRLTVVGDVLLDRWWSGVAERLAREAPTPVVQLTGRRDAPGGAGNVAANAAALGAVVSLLGAVGADRFGRRVAELVAGAGVAADLIVDDRRLTPAKTRVLAGDQIVARLDEGSLDGGSPVDPDRVASAVAGADAVLVADYGSGRWQQPVRQALSRVGRPPLLVIDAHDPAAWSDLRPDIATPDRAEAFALLGRPVGPLAALRPRLDEVHRATGAGTTVVTLDRDGTLVLQPGPDGRAGVVHRTHATVAHESCSTGAGDTFVAALTFALACGATPSAAADLGQRAADVVLRQPGTGVCRAADLAAPPRRSGRTIALPDLEREVAQARQRGARVVFTNGCFDVLHRGHTSYLREAAALGDLLVVAVNSDDSVRRLKGPSRPVNPAGDRCAVLAALGSVDLVTTFDSPTPVPLLRRLRPDVYVKGGDYTPQMLSETAVVQGYGGEVRIVGYSPACSTTDVLARIQAGAPVD